jgi:hypothetical protein
MEVQGIGALKLLTEQEDVDVDEPAANVGQQAGDNVHFQGTGTTLCIPLRSFCGTIITIHKAYRITTPILHLLL